MAWIFTIAKNLALMKLRYSAKADITDDIDTHNEAEISFSFIEDVEQRLIVETSINKLEEDERIILMLHAVGGLKNREIAQLLEVPVNTVLSKYNRTIKKMQKYLEKEGF